MIFAAKEYGEEISHENIVFANIGPQRRLHVCKASVNHLGCLQRLQVETMLVYVNVGAELGAKRVGSRRGLWRGWRVQRSCLIEHGIQVKVVDEKLCGHLCAIREFMPEASLGAEG